MNNQRLLMIDDEFYWLIKQLFMIAHSWPIICDSGQWRLLGTNFLEWWLIMIHDGQWWLTTWRMMSDEILLGAHDPWMTSSQSSCCDVSCQPRLWIVAYEAELFGFYRKCIYQYGFQCWSRFCSNIQPSWFCSTSLPSLNNVWQWRALLSQDGFI